MSSSFPSFSFSLSFSISSRTPPTPSHYHRRLDSPRFGASHDSAIAVVGPRLRITHALRLAAAITHVCTHARMVRHATKREIIPRAACGPFVIRPYRRGGTNTRTKREGGRGTQKGTRARLARHASKTAARGLSPAYLPTCIVACA